MIDSTPLTVIDEGPAGTTQLVVEADARRQAQKALQNAFVKTGNRAGPMAFQGEDVLAGREDGLDPLAKGSHVRPLSALVLALGPDVSDPQSADRRGELFARVAFVGEKDLSACARAASKDLETHLPFIAFGRGKRKRPGGAVGGEDGMQPDSPEVAGVAGAVSVVTDVGRQAAGTQLDD